MRRFRKFLFIIPLVILHVSGGSVKRKTNSSLPILAIELDTTRSLLPHNTRSNLEMLLSLAPAYKQQNPARLKSDLELPQERAGAIVTHEEDNPLPLTSTTKKPTPASSGPEHPKEETLVSSVKQYNSTVPGSLVNGSIQNSTTIIVRDKSPGWLTVQPSSVEEILSVKEDQPRPMTNFQNIKDAYFDLLQQFKEFRRSVMKKIATLEQKVDNQMTVRPNGTSQMDSMGTRIEEVYDKVMEVELRHNLTRLIDLCVFKVLGEDLDDAVLLWQKIELSIGNPVDQETSGTLKEIVAMAYVRNKTNSNPVFRFLRKIQDVDKIPSYEYLLSGMRQRDDFNGGEIFHIAQYLKEHNAVRSTLFSRIPKSVQAAVSGRNINIVYYEPRTGRNYLHVRDDGNRRDRHNYYIKASQSYTEPKAAVWRAVYYPGTESFRIRNVLFNDYMFLNDEGFLETTSMANANQLGTEFNFELSDNLVTFRSRTFNGEPLVATWSGGKFPFYFSLRREGNSDKEAANFFIEPDSLL